jgi:protease I
MPRTNKKKIRVAILVEKDYQDMEVWYPIFRLREAEIDVVTVGVNQTSYKGKYGYPIECSTLISKLKASSLDGVIIPGGWAPDFLRLSPEVLKLVSDMNKAGKVVSSICHGGWVLASAGILKGRTVTSYIAIRDDMVHAGAKWVDEETVVDSNLITARTPNDLPAFVKSIIKICTATSHG